MSQARFAQLRMGDRLQPMATPEVRMEALVEMAEVLSDHNPIHIDREMARAQGFSDALQQGPLTQSLCMLFLQERIAPHKVKSCRFRFQDNVFVSDRIYINGEVSRKVELAGKTHVTCNLWAEKQDGTAVLNGSVDLELL